MKGSWKLGRGLRLGLQALVLTLMSSSSAYALNCGEVRELTGLYFKMHYSYNTFDDELSQRTLDNFVKAWDPGKLYFFESDIKDFEKKYASKIDDMVNAGKCDAVDDIMSRFSKRFEERQKAIFKIIDQKHDFTKDEYMTIDRKKLAYAKTEEEINERWRQRVKFQLLSLKNGLDSLAEVNKDDKAKKPAKDPLVEAREKLKKRYELALKRHNELTKDKVLGVFLNAFSTALDPHSSYMPADELEDFRINTRLSLEGIGASLRSEDGFTIVVSLVKGGAAEKGGLLAINDKIIAVAQGDGEPVDVIDMELSEVVKLIRGARGTTVKLTVMRKDAKEAKKLIVPIVREKIQLVDRQASSKVIDVAVKENGKDKVYKVGVITLPSFYIDFEGRHKRLANYRSSSNDTIREIKKLQDKKVDAIVMDLRNNGGGSLEESINMAGLFFDKGPVVQVKEQSGQTQAFFDRDGKTYYDGPLVVMINRNSASASEIFAGAIQDYGRGLIVGDSHTFGKGTVQNLNDVAAKLGAVKVTVNKFYRASGASTQLEGVQSDIRLPSLFDEWEVGEKYYDYALPFETIKKVPHEQLNEVAPYVDALKKRSDARVAASEDFKKVLEEIKKFRSNEDERSRVSLKEEKADPKKASEEDPALAGMPEDEDAELAIVDDIYLQEGAKIAGDYLQLLAGKKALGDVELPAVLAEKAKRDAKKDRKTAQVKSPAKGELEPSARPGRDDDKPQGLIKEVKKGKNDGAANETTKDKAKR